MNLEPTREAYERMLMDVSQAVLGGDASVVAMEPVQSFLARVEATSRVASGRVVALNMHSEWLEAVFVMSPNLGVFVADDFGVDEAYTIDQVGRLVEVAHAYLLGKGSLESRRTVLGKRRTQLRLEVNGREWVAR